MDSDASGSGGWRFAQCFGDKGEVEDITEGELSLSGHPNAIFAVLTLSFAADIISTVEFDSTGNYLATGDKGGRVVLFERNESVSVVSVSLPQCGDAVWHIPAYVLPALPILLCFIQTTEKRLRIQVLHGVSITRARV